MTDLLLTHGYFLFEDPNEKKVMKPYPPLGILYLASYLKSKGFEIGVLDTTFQTFHEASSLLQANKPSAVGIYCNLMTKPNVLKLIRLCKQLGATVILGGPEPPHYAQEYLRFGADIVVMGEGELVLEDLLPALAKGNSADLGQISGIAFQDGEGNVVKTPPRSLYPVLDELPFPDRDSIDMQQYVDIWRQHHGMGSVSLICSRGCPYTCTWCSHSVYGFSHRRRSPTNVVDEVELILSEYKPDMLWYADDVFTINHRWLFEYASELEKRNLRIPFECISREDRLNEKIIATLAKMGCFRLWIGSESGSQRLLDEMRRRTDVERVRAMTRMLQDYGIQAGMFIMLGYEGETRDDLEATAEHLKKSNPDVFLTTVAYPIKGTEYYESLDGRVVHPKPWQHETDRDLRLAGNHTRKYYGFANRWLVNEVALHHQRNNGKRSAAKVAKHFLNAQLGRLGMAFTQHQSVRQESRTTFT